MKILCIYRAEEYSPNMVDKDRDILDRVAAILHSKGNEVITIPEEELTPDATSGYHLVLSMARRPATLQLLSQLTIPVLNTPQSVQAASIRNTFFTSCSPDQFPLWVKKPTGYSQAPDDIIYVETPDQLRDALTTFASKGIANPFLSHHYQGQQIKFYRILGTDFFHCIPTANTFSKFGWETTINQHPAPCTLHP